MEANVWAFLRDRVRLFGWLFVACGIPGALLLCAGVSPGIVLTLLFLGSAVTAWRANPSMLVLDAKPKLIEDETESDARQDLSQHSRRDNSDRALRYFSLRLAVITILCSASSYLGELFAIGRAPSAAANFSAIAIVVAGIVIWVCVVLAWAIRNEHRRNKEDSAVLHEVD